MSESDFDRMSHGECPNECGKMTMLKKRQPMLHLIPIELIDSPEIKDVPEGEYGYLTGVCPECGFILITGYLSKFDERDTNGM